MWVAALARAIVRLGMHSRKFKRNALPLAEFVSLIKPSPFTPRQEDYCGLGWQL
jgi:hypothetical protein